MEMAWCNHKLAYQINNIGDVRLSNGQADKVARQVDETQL